MSLSSCPYWKFVYPLSALCWYIINLLSCKCEKEGLHEQFDFNNLRVKKGTTGSYILQRVSYRKVSANLHLPSSDYICCFKSDSRYGEDG